MLPAPDSIVVSVRDHGPGIPPAAAGRVFDKFQRLGDSHSGGSGLGLAVSRGFVEAHGGRLWLDETPGSGATFRFSLPLERSADGVRRTADRCPANASSARRPSGAPAGPLSDPSAGPAPSAVRRPPPPDQ